MPCSKCNDHGSYWSYIGDNTWGNMFCDCIAGQQRTSKRMEWYGILLAKDGRLPVYQVDLVIDNTEEVGDGGH